jgi:hypothetical protein
LLVFAGSNYPKWIGFEPMLPPNKLAEPGWVDPAKLIKQHFDKADRLKKEREP